MGSRYTNLTIKGSTQNEVFEFVADRSAYVSPVVSGCVVLLDQLSESDPEYEMVTLATALSMKFACSVLTVKVVDSDVLAYWLHGKGRLLDWYNSFSGEIEPGRMLQGPSGDKPDALITAFGTGTRERILQILITQHSAGPYVSEDRRHADLLDQLSLPKCAVGVGYDYFCRGVAGNKSLPPFRATSQHQLLIIGARRIWKMFPADPAAPLRLRKEDRGATSPLFRCRPVGSPSGFRTASVRRDDKFAYRGRDAHY